MGFILQSELKKELENGWADQFISAMKEKCTSVFDAEIRIKVCYKEEAFFVYTFNSDGKPYIIAEPVNIKNVNDSKWLFYRIQDVFSELTEE